MSTRIGKYTVRLDSAPSVISFAAAGSKMEAEGPLGAELDYTSDDSYFGEKSFEKAESKLQTIAVTATLDRVGLAAGDIDYVFAGDLLNQCIGSTYGLRDTNIPFLGLYGACSTMAESLSLASLFLEGGIADRCLAVTSSHFCSAERQFRFPLEYAGQRTPTSQWTATAAGAAIVAQSSCPPYVRAVTIGSIVDKGITDANNMGAAMAPAAASTLVRYFSDTLTNQEKYDIVLTGDLGAVGSELLYQLMDKEGFNIRNKHKDCGLMLYDRDTQDVVAGGSGCGCSAAVLCGHILKQIRKGALKDVLFVATGALMSPTSTQQGESIPSVAHLVHLSSEPG